MEAETLKQLLSNVLSIVKTDVTLKADGSRIIVGGATEQSVIVGSCVSTWTLPEMYLSNESAQQLSKALTKGPIELYPEEETMVLKTRRSTITFALLHVGPSVEKLLTNLQRDFPITLNGEVFAAAINRVRHYANSKDTKIAKYKGLTVKVGPKVEVVATDNSSLALTEFENPGYTGDPVTVILNEEFITLSKVFVGNMNIAFADKHCSVRARDGDYTYLIVSGLVPSEPIKYDSLIENLRTKLVDRVRVPRKDLLESLRINDYFTDNAQRFKVLVEYDTNLRITSENERGNAQYEIQALDSKVTTPGSVRLKLNALLAAVNNTNSDYIEFLFGGEKSMVLVQDGHTINTIVFLKQ